MLRIRPDALAEIETALHEYRSEVESNAALTESTKQTYLVHVERFVRWLGGDAS